MSPTRADGEETADRRGVTRASTLLEDAARQGGWSVERLERDLVLVRGDATQAAFVGMKGPGITRVGEAITRSLSRTRHCAELAGVPVIESEEFPACSLTDARDWARERGGTWTVRSPLQRTIAGGTPRVSTDERFAAAWLRVTRLRRRAGQRVLVERSVHGPHVKVLVVDGRLVAATRLDPPALVGDGRAAVAELLAAENERRRHDPLLRHHPVVLPARLRRDPARIAEAGERIVLARWPIVGAGATAVDVTDRLDAAAVALAERAVAALPGLRYATAVLVLPHRLEEVDGPLVYGVEAEPPIEACFPSRGRPREVAGQVLACELGPAPGTTSGRWRRSWLRRQLANVVPAGRRSSGASTGTRPVGR
jgi:cyanophycin synthetase